MNKRGINEVVLTGVVYDNAKKDFSDYSKRFLKSKYLTRFILVCGNSFSEKVDIRIPVIAYGKCADRANLIARRHAFIMVKGEICSDETIDRTNGKVTTLPIILINEITLLKTADKIDLKDLKFRNVLMANDPNNYSKLTKIPKVRHKTSPYAIERRDIKNKEENKNEEV